QPELRFKLQQGNLKQIVQRVTVQCHLKGLKKNEVKQYINHRLEIGGGSRFDIFPADTIDRIAVYARGIPRLINVLCDSTLVYGFADELKTISISILDNVYEELKTLGTFTGYDAKPSASPVSPVPTAGSTPGPPIAHEYMALLEEKIERLEDKIGDFNKRLDFYSQKRTERDDIVVELFQMLKDNLDKRWQLIDSFGDFKSTIISTKAKKDSGRAKSSSAARISSLSRHKQNKG
nr:hypothetical protein [Desulfobacterales bacterium]